VKENICISVTKGLTYCSNFDGLNKVVSLSYSTSVINLLAYSFIYCAELVAMEYCVAAVSVFIAHDNYYAPPLAGALIDAFV